MATEYEQLLQQMLDEGRAKLETLRTSGASTKKVSEEESDLRFIEIELEAYRRGLALFRTKQRPKVGRWGKPEIEEHPSPPSTTH